MVYQEKPLRDFIAEVELKPTQQCKSNGSYIFFKLCNCNGRLEHFTLNFVLKPSFIILLSNLRITCNA